MSQDFVIDHTDTHGPDHLVPPELQNDPSMTVWIYIMHERYVHDVERFVPGNLLAARSVQSTAWGPAVSMVDPVLHTPAQELLLLHATVACPSCMFPLQAEHRIC